MTFNTSSWLLEDHKGRQLVATCSNRRCNSAAYFLVQSALFVLFLPTTVFMTFAGLSCCLIVSSMFNRL